MQIPLLIAALLATGVGIGHSYLGERFILIRLFRRDLPKIGGSDVFTKRTLRFAWHLTSVAWWGFAAILVVLASPEPANPRNAILAVISGTFAVHAAVTGIASRGRHAAWLVFLAITVLAWIART
jgi:hypothetical protein